MTFALRVLCFRGWEELASNMLLDRRMPEHWPGAVTGGARKRKVTNK
jgi:hypothetical protein